MENSDGLNKIYMEKLFPSIIWMCVCCITGTVGNTLVLLVYGLRMETKIGDGRYFIPVLAFFDLLSSLLASLHGLFDFFFYVNYPSDSLCKFLTFGSFFTSAISAHTLLLIAIQRYRKICVPLGKQMSSFWKKRSFAVTFLFCFSYSLPVSFTAGLKNSIEHLSTTNETVSSCAMNSGRFPLFYKIYLSVAFLIMLSNIVAVAVLYFRIACYLYEHSSRRHSSPDGTRLPTAWSRKDDSIGKHSKEVLEADLEENSTKTGNVHLSLHGIDVISVELNQLNKCTPKTLSDGQTEYRGPSKEDENEDTVPARAFQRDRRNSKLNRSKVNFNRLFGVIVIFYLLAYVPTLILFLVASVCDMKDLDLNVYVFLNRLYIVNHIVNPFIYGYFDFCFRHSLTSLINCKQENKS